MSSPTRPPEREPRPRTAAPDRHGHAGRAVAASLITGLLAALILALTPLVPAHEDAAMGAVLIGFAGGWTMLALLTTRFTAAPQRWAYVPAAFLGLSGLLLLTIGPAAGHVLDWVWPPAVLVLAIWAIGHVRRLPSRGGRRLLYPVVAALALASIGAGYETVREAVDARAFSMPGRLIDVGGHRLHLNCTGTGSPTVVLEPGGGEMASTLGWIAPGVARTTRVCVYDRAGRGWSDPADTPQDGTQIASDLHTLLHRAGVPGPYVLAGHSFGGLYVLAFADRYPDEVAGMVLVDSTAPAAADSRGTTAGEGRDEILPRVSALLANLARFGLARAYAQMDFDGLPVPSRDEVRASTATPHTVRSTIDEYVQASASMREAAALHDLSGKPLVVLTASVGHDAAWSSAQDHLATLSTDTVHRVVQGATHGALLADESDAAVTTQAIVEVVSAARTAQPLPR